MANIFLSKRSKLIVDILLIIGFAGIWGQPGESWKSAHCIGSAIWLILMLIHVAQHWKFTKSLAKWKVARKNKVTTLTALMFALMLFSIFLFAIHAKGFFLFHGLVGHFLFLLIIIHTLTKLKRLVYLSKSVGKSSQPSQKT